MESQPLVSVIVITYNSAGTVVETLESIKAQTYPRIELIVTDDCSTDGTQEIVEEWLRLNEGYFSAAAFIPGGKNTGISGNCNRGLVRAKGAYVKFIAGDDMLLEECIGIDLGNIGDSMVLCTALMFRKGGETWTPLTASAAAAFFSGPKDTQKRRYLRRPVFLNTPSLFFRREIFDRIGAFDERIRLLEDQPFICKLLVNGYTIQYTDRATVIYRLSEASVTGRRSRLFLDSQYLCYKYYIRPALRLTNFIDLLVIIESSVYFLLERKGMTTSALYTIFMRSRPSRVFLEGDFFNRAFKRLFLAGGQGGIR